MSYKKLEKAKKTNIKGTSERPRMSVFRSNRFISVQIIDDSEGITLVSASSLNLDVPNNIETAEKIGKEIATLAKKKSIKSIVFDRGRYQYKGRVKALAESARAEGLEF